ncbi:hypothetical protein WMY93_025281 [Mugilogobius chulae]|uniref:Uncharacterized protein n=1 Tax=Mugilogobius chulae TaxID=88201 RepID=A0AAW0N238_9GOBI
MFRSKLRQKKSKKRCRLPQRQTRQEDASKPKVVDLTLPGWGEWGGQGLKPSKAKRRRFRIKPGPVVRRKDAKLPDVICRKTETKASPRIRQLESTIRCPLGRTWNSEKTVKKMTQPKVVTQLGTIIEPMGREELRRVSRTRQSENTSPDIQKNTQPKGKKRPAQKRKKHKA